MAIVAEDNRNVIAHRVRPSRSSAIANAGTQNNVPSVVDILDVELASADGGHFIHRTRDYVIVIDQPTVGNVAYLPFLNSITDPQIGDRVRAFRVGSSPANPTVIGYDEFIRTSNAAWQRVSLASVS